MRKPIIAGNWKMHKTAGEGVALVEQLRSLLDTDSAVDIVVCPPFTALAAVAGAAAGSKIILGAQNMHWQDKGAYTGEISPGMLRDIGCTYVIIGHSERRQYFAETDQTTNSKVKAAFQTGLSPILCVGETLAERESGATEQVVGRQVQGGIDGLTAEQAAALVIAYEPVWAIGTGRTASADEADAVCRFIRHTVAGMFGQGAADNVRIQYGGSVKPDNVAELMAKPDIDGALVGGACLEAESFSKLVKLSVQA